MECQSCATYLHSERLAIQVQLKVVCTSDMEEQVLFRVNVFTLQEVTIML
jgi:hypothetical protein